jgi:hypothetical protein
MTGWTSDLWTLLRRAAGLAALKTSPYMDSSSGAVKEKETANSQRQLHRHYKTHNGREHTPVSWVPAILNTSNLWKRRKQSGIGPEKTVMLQQREGLQVLFTFEAI